MNEPIARPTRRLVALGLAASLHSLGPAAAQPRSEAKPAGPAAVAEPKAVLRARPARRRLLPGSETAEEAETWAFAEDGAVPVLRIRKGEELFVRLVNGTPSPLALHWQGMRGPNGFDGVAGLTQPALEPGGSVDCRFTPPDPGTFLLRPIVPGRSGEAAGRGLAGILVVEEPEPPAVAADHILLVRDWRLEPSGAFAPFGAPMEAALAGRLGNRLATDAGEAPKRIDAAPGARIRLRAANASNARILRLRFDNLKVFVAAVDSQPADNFEPLRSSLPFPPGTRYDLMIEAPAEPGAKGAVVALIGDGVPLAEIVAAGERAAAVPTPAPAPPRLQPNKALPAEIRLQNAIRRDVVLAGGATRGPAGEPVFTGDPKSIWTVSGAAGSAAAKPLFTARRGQPVVLALVNQTGFPQPMHLHGHVCRLLHGLDDGWEPYWLDTLQVPEGKVSRIAFIADNPGRWMLGSTVLERLDTGLWTWFEVT